MEDKYIDVKPDQPIDEEYNHEPRELDVPDFPQGKQHVVTTKVVVADKDGNLHEEEIGKSQGELSPNPGYGEDGETKDATKTHLVKGEIPADGGEFVNQSGIKVVKDPHNFVGDLLIKGKPIEEYVDSQGGVTEEELTTKLSEYTKKSEVATQLVGKDIQVEGVTSKGIANTGGFANIGDVAISGDLNVQGEGKGVINCNAVIQKPRYSFDISLPNVTGMTKTQWYTKVVVIGNELHIIGNARYVNNTEATIAFRLAVFTISDIPQEIGKLIYDENGDTLEKSPVTVEGGSPIIRVSPISLQTTTGLVHGMRLAHSDPNQIQVYHNQTANVGAGASVIVGFHVTLELE